MTMMSDNVFWILEADINAGHLDNLKALIGEMVVGTKHDEPGALDYQWFISDDGTMLHIYERYADSEAVMVHRRNFAQKYAERFQTYLTVTKITMYGDPSADVRAGFAASNPLYIRLAEGFAR
jgi:quinol monooxygenase YgiN